MVRVTLYDLDKNKVSDAELDLNYLPPVIITDFASRVYTPNVASMTIDTDGVLRADYYSNRTVLLSDVTRIEGK